jgi:hypothetical protein
MGVFDYIILKCPRCEEEIEEQTKYGDASFSTHHVRIGEPIDVYKAAIMCGFYTCRRCECCFEIVAPNVELEYRVVNMENT